MTLMRFLSLNFSALARPDQRSKAFKTFSELMQTGAQIEITGVDSDANMKYVDVETSSIIFHEGKPYAIRGRPRQSNKRVKKLMRKS